MIRWRAAGIEPGTISLLWSEPVAAEIVVFVLVVPRLLARLGAALCGLAIPLSRGLATTPSPLEAAVTR